MFPWHYRRVLDALQGRRGIARAQDVAWPAGIASRQELYEMRDRGQLPMQAFIDTFCVRLGPEDDRLEAG
jgi:hypothetical protein